MPSAARGTPPAAATATTTRSPRSSPLVTTGRSRCSAAARSWVTHMVETDRSMDDDPTAFPTLDAEQFAALDAVGTRRHFEAGEFLYRQGDADYDFYVVVSGVIDILVGSGGDER